MTERKVEPIVYLLFIGMALFAVALVLVKLLFPQDGQMFQVFAGLLSGFSGAFFMRIRSGSQAEKLDQSSNIVVAQQNTEPQQQ